MKTKKYKRRNDMQHLGIWVEKKTYQEFKEICQSQGFSMTTIFKFCMMEHINIYGKRIKPIVPRGTTKTKKKERKGKK